MRDKSSCNIAIRVFSGIFRREMARDNDSNDDDSDVA